jgi:CheY-like chemotaxis protein
MPEDWEQWSVAAQQDISQITRAAQRAAELTHQLLAFARREVIQPTLIDLNDRISSAEELLSRTMGPDMEITTTCDPDLWPILADVSQMDQVLLNLFINSRDAMPQGGRITVDTRNTEVDEDSVAGGSSVWPGRYVRLRISDTGIGMSTETVARAFEPFYSTKADGSGTGLGLATVYGIIAQADGTIDIQSEVGVGTTFTIMLPASAETQTTMVPAEGVQRPVGTKTVLVVDDEEPLREVTSRILTRGGYHVLAAANGPAAIALAANYESEIDLILTDVVMPGMLGKEVAARIRQTRPEAVVLFMSGYAEGVLTSQGRLESGVSLVEKPFSAEALLTKAAAVLREK